MSKRYDLTGKMFDRLTVISKHGVAKQKTMWLCKCDCGNETLVRTGDLNAGLVKSCGCMHRDSARRAGKSRFIDLTGRKLERLTVIKLIKKAKNYNLWECQCECGKTIKARGGDLRSGNTKSCGCLQVEVAKEEGKKYADKILANVVEGTHLAIIASGLSKNNTSGIKGVYWSTKRQKWEARLGFKGEVYNLGAYDKIEDAAKARKEAEELYHKPMIEKYRGE